MTGESSIQVPDRSSPVAREVTVDTARPAIMREPTENSWAFALGIALVLMSLALSAWMIQNATEKTPSPILGAVTS